jgi:hypothetical protein
VHLLRARSSPPFLNLPNYQEAFVYLHSFQCVVSPAFCAGCRRRSWSAERFNVATHFMLRTVESGREIRVPSPEAIAHLGHRQPSTRVKVALKPEQHLSELQGQDTYSYELAEVYIGGRDQLDLLDKYDEALTALQFDIDNDEQTVVVYVKRQPVLFTSRLLAAGLRDVPR